MPALFLKLKIIIKGLDMLLIYNTILSEANRKHFDVIARERLFPGSKLQTMYLQENFDDISEYSHLLVTGSELSAAAGSEHDDHIFAVIERFINAKKPVLAICHGHQMLARLLADDNVCRRSLKPEFGFKKMQITDDDIFAGIKNPIFLESRYDEVFDPPPEFNIIARNDQEAVQAFRYKNLPVWGVQFHPEYLFEDGQAMLQNHLNQTPQDKLFYQNELKTPNQMLQNLKIFQNFLL
jgi:GMP synthase (glutamine-hydrolysing)